MKKLALASLAALAISAQGAELFSADGYSPVAVSGRVAFYATRSAGNNQELLIVTTQCNMRTHRKAVIKVHDLGTKQTIATFESNDAIANYMLSQPFKPFDDASLGQIAHTLCSRMMR